MTVTNTAIPVVTGTARQGQTLHTTNGSWTFDLDHLTYAYQWRRCDAAGANCVDIAGATSANYTLTAADVGHEIRARVTATEVNDSTGTVVFDQSAWDDLGPPWTAMFDYTGTPNVGVGVQGSPSGRVRIVTAPDGVGRALRTEIRDSDPGWPNNPANDRAHLQVSTSGSFGQSRVNVGDIFYFDFELWLPLNDPVGDYFDYPRNQWYRLWEPHEGTGTRWSGFTLVSDGLPANNAWMPLRVAGGSYPSTAAYYPLFQLTNSDGSWHTQNFNRRLHIRYGGRWAPDNTGYHEAWVDGVQVVQRTNHANMWTGDSGQYLTPGQYKAHGDPFPHYGKSVMYILKCTTEKM